MKGYRGLYLTLTDPLHSTMPCRAYAAKLLKRVHVHDSIAGISCVAPFGYPKVQPWGEEATRSRVIQIDLGLALFCAIYEGLSRLVMSENDCASPSTEDVRHSGRHTLRTTTVPLIGLDLPVVQAIDIEAIGLELAGPNVTGLTTNEILGMC